MNQAPDWFRRDIIGRLTAAFPSWPCSAATIQVFAEALSDLARPDIERATVAYIASETAWPTAAGVRKYATAPAALAEMTAAEAWRELAKNREAHLGRYGLIRWSSPAIQRAAEAVNWTDRDWQTEQMPTIRAQFERYYLATHAKAKQVATLEVAQLLLDQAKPVNGQPRLLFGGKGTP